MIGMTTVLLHLPASNIKTDIGDVVESECERLLITDLAFEPTSTMRRGPVRCIDRWLDELTS